MMVIYALLALDPESNFGLLREDATRTQHSENSQCLCGFRVIVRRTDAQAVAPDSRSNCHQNCHRESAWTGEALWRGSLLDIKVVFS